MYVRYLVCIRDKLALRSELDKLGFDYDISVHGSIDFHDKITDDQLDNLKVELLKSCLIPLDDDECLQIDKIIDTVVELVHYTDKLPKSNLIKIISAQVDLDVDSIQKMFSDVKGMSLQHFIDIHKIERVKELLLFDGMPIPEIAELLDYKNKEQLVALFKKATGLSPSYFKRLNKERTDFAKQQLDSHRKVLSAKKDISDSKAVSDKNISGNTNNSDMKIQPGGMFAQGLNRDI